MTNLGLILIIIGWVIQLGMLSPQNKNIQLPFVVIYSLGVLLLVVDGFRIGLNTTAYLNLVSFIAAAFVTYRLFISKK